MYLFLAQLITQLIVFNSCVAFNPVPGYVECGIELVQLHPQVLVFYRLFVGGFPALGLPGVNPLGNAVFYILAVYIYSNVSSRKSRGILYYRKSSNGGAKLHLIVGGHGFATAKAFYYAVGNNNNTPATRARVSGAATICIDYDIVHVRAPTPARLL